MEAVASCCRALAEASSGDLEVRRRQLTELLRAEDLIREGLHALGLFHPTTNGEPGPRPASTPEFRECLANVALPGRDAGAARDLARTVAAAERDSAALLARLTHSGDQGTAELQQVARRCHAMLEDALLLGAVELAALLGVPDDQIPH